MFANRFTAFVDACTLARVLPRNLLLSLAEAEFFRVRWSATVLDETEKAIKDIRTRKGGTDAADHAARARQAMESAFEDAMVVDFDRFFRSCEGLPDPKDAHVVAAALKTQASVIVTENLRHFPQNILAPLNLDVRSADSFIADTIALDEGRAVPAIRRMRERFKKPAMSAKDLLLLMEVAELTETVDVLSTNIKSL